MCTALAQAEKKGGRTNQPQSYKVEHWIIRWSLVSHLSLKLFEDIYIYIIVCKVSSANNSWIYHQTSHLCIFPMSQPHSWLRCWIQVRLCVPLEVHSKEWHHFFFKDWNVRPSKVEWIHLCTQNLWVNCSHIYRKKTTFWGHFMTASCCRQVFFCKRLGGWLIGAMSLEVMARLRVDKPPWFRCTARIHDWRLPGSSHQSMGSVKNGSFQYGRIVTFQLGQFSTSMIMGERVCDVHIDILLTISGKHPATMSHPLMRGWGSIIAGNLQKNLLLVRW